MPDVIVVLPGIMGSVLEKNGREVWAVSGSALLNGLKTLGRSIADLELSDDSPDVEALDDGIVATRIFPDTHLIPGFWKIDGYSGLRRAILEAFDVRQGGNYHEFAYDWRRDNRASARRLARLAGQWLAAWRKTNNSDAKLILIAHSMGGLVARYFLEVLGGWRDTRMLITFGTPYRGSLNALNFLVNGLRKNIGPLTAFDLSSLVRSFTSTYQLLPTYPCYDAGDGELQRVAHASGIPNIDARRASAAFDFHEEIRRAVERNETDPSYSRRYSMHPIVGVDQVTAQIARRAGNGVELLDSHPADPHIAGDGTVPEASATPIESDTLTAQHHKVFVSDVHGSLQNSQPMLVHVRSLLAGANFPGAVFRSQTEPFSERFSLSIDDIFATSEDVIVSVASKSGRANANISIQEAQSGRELMLRRVTNVEGQVQSVAFGSLPEGLYRVRVLGDRGGSATDVFLVMQS